MYSAFTKTTAASLAAMHIFGGTVAFAGEEKKAPKQVETQMVVILDDETGEAIRGVDAKTGADKGKIMIAAEKEQGWFSPALTYPFAVAIPKDDFRKNGVQMGTPLTYGQSYFGVAGGFISDLANGALGWAGLKYAYGWKPAVENNSWTMSQQQDQQASSTGGTVGPISLNNSSTSKTGPVIVDQTTVVKPTQTTVVVPSKPGHGCGHGPCF